MDKEKLKRTVEALVFVTDAPLSVQKLKDITDSGTNEIKEVLAELKQEYESRDTAVFLKEVAGGFQIATKQEYGEWVKKLYQDKITYRLTKSGLETLSIVAYKQPVTRSEVEDIRGVDSSGVLENLLEKKLVKICGRKEVAGRPMLYGTTNDFLKFFGLKNLADLPSLEELLPPVQDELKDDIQNELPMQDNALENGQPGEEKVEEEAK